MKDLTIEKEKQMSTKMTDDQELFAILVNKEGQYSLWQDFRAIPNGWQSVGPRGKREECLDWIKAQWTDMRPKSLRDSDA